MEANPADAGRHARHLSVAALGAAGQARIGDARVHVVGAGALAGPALLYLAQAGVGALFLDDGEDVEPGDGASWLYPPDQVGALRVVAAREPLHRASGQVRVRPYATGAPVSAALIFPASRGVALQASEQARLAGLPHVVASAHGDGGLVVSVPVGAACYRCAGRPAPAARPPPGAASVVGILGALELLLLVAGAVQGPEAGRCIEVAGGLPQARATVRRPGCDCSNAY